MSDNIIEGESTLVFYVNGKKITDNNVDPEWTLLYYLRNKLRLCGTKLGCAEGGCGACTIMVSRYNRKKQKIIHLAVNACLAPICSVHGCAVTTVEGIGSTRTKLHPVQERLAKAHGSQCGFCTPGIIMSMYALLRQNNKPRMLDMEIAFQGNLCRCTGYRPIIEGLRTFTEEWEESDMPRKLGWNSRKEKSEKNDEVDQDSIKENELEHARRSESESQNDTSSLSTFSDDETDSDKNDLNSNHELSTNVVTKADGEASENIEETNKNNSNETKEDVEVNPEKLIIKNADEKSNKINGLPEGKIRTTNDEVGSLNETNGKINGTNKDVSKTNKQRSSVNEKNGADGEIKGVNQKIKINNETNGTRGKTSENNRYSGTKGKINGVNGINGTNGKVNGVNGINGTNGKVNGVNGINGTNGKINGVNGINGTNGKVNGVNGINGTNGKVNGVNGINGTKGKINSVNGINGTNGKVNGVNGINGTNGKINGVNGINGTNGKVNGVNGINGTNGKVNGVNGINGTNGKINGVNGINGTNGKVNGVNGINGTNGKINGVYKINGTNNKIKSNYQNGENNGVIKGDKAMNERNKKVQNISATNGKKIIGIENKKNSNGVNGFKGTNGTSTKVNGNSKIKIHNIVNGATKEKIITSGEKLTSKTKNNLKEEMLEKKNEIIEEYPVLSACGMGKNCCKFNAETCYKNPEEILFSYNEFSPYDPSQEVIFPPDLMLNSTLDEQTLVIRGPRATWYRPTSFKDVLLIKSKFPQAKIINGNTEVGVEVKFKNFIYPVLVNPVYVKEMTEIVFLEEGIKFGAAVTLNEINDVLKHEIATKPEHKTRIFKAATHILHWFAGKQIRNVSAIGGNIMTGSPISDMNPVLMAADVDLHLTSLDSTRVIKMDHTFFTGYRRNVVKPEEVLTAIVFPYSHEDQYFNAYKQAKRRDDDIAIVNCAANVEFEPGTDVIKNIIIAYGGVSPCTTRAMKTREKLLGRAWNDEMVEDAFTYLVEELPLPPNAPGGNVLYRRSLTLSLFFKFYLFVREKLSKKYTFVDPLPDRMLSGIPGFHSKDLKSSQYFQVVPKHQEKVDAVGRTLVHVNAFKQATGEAIYCDDIPRVENELYVTLVLSTKPHAKILNIDTSEALAMPGVHAFFCDKDLDEGCNEMGPIFHDEKVFYSDKVTSQGQVIGAIVADNQMISQRASKLVKIQYEDLSPVIISIEQAIEHNSFILPPKKIISGNVEEAFKTCDFVKEGEVRMGGQEHFYLETHCALAIPREDEIEIFSSSQNAAEIQKLAALVLNIPCNRVITRVKRIGGGFGGKESRANILAIPLALIAHRMKRPVRCMFDRDEDMISSGTRHPFMARYKVGFNRDGKIMAVQMYIYCNAGYSMDLSIGVLDRSLFHAENSYKIPNMEVHGYMCLTNLPSNTAFRGFGGPQGMFFIESIIDEVAYTVNKPQEEIRYMNMYREGDITHYNQLLEHCTARRCWEECYRNSDFERRKAEIIEFNKKNRYKKRGISIIPTKFGIAFTEVSLNQAGALVHVYRDGSVLLSHGGVEIGQGLNTKMIQVASRALGIDASMIYISETATDKVPNASATAASAGSDLNGMAVMNACHKIVKRLEPFKKANPEGTWKEWIAKAYHSRVGLSATGFYMTPGLGYNFNTNSGKAFNYYTYGAAVSSVEIDCLSGDHQVLRTDIVMDLGESLNPAIDIGQIEGAFVQGQGLFTLEELIYSPTGTSFTRGPGMYKVPGFADIPLEFNVALLRGAPNPRAVYSSKAVGEPPLFLASSVFFAIKNAIAEARAEEGIFGNFRFDSPATSWRIRTHCLDRITAQFPTPDPKSYQPWNVVP